MMLDYVKQIKSVWLLIVKKIAEESVKYKFNKNCRPGIDIQSRRVCYIFCYFNKQKKHL